MRRLRRKWYVRRALPNEEQLRMLPESAFEPPNLLLEGSETACKRYYKKNGGTKCGLVLGYHIPDEK